MTRTIRILLLEDGAEDMMMYKRLLSRSTEPAFDIAEADTIAKARALVDIAPYDCYVVDYRLPDGDGIEFIRHLDALHNGANHSAIVMVTGQGSEEIAVEALKIGAHDYITKKSISDGYFIRPIMNALERARLAEQIKHYQEELVRSNSELSEFAHTASHDLKAPIRRIISYCEILQEEAAERLTEEDVRIIERMTVNARRMQSLIDGLLNYSLLDYEKEEKADVDLSKVLDDLMEEYDPQIREVAAKVEVQKLPEVHAYPLRVRQLFSNLISNALKYRSPNKPLRIEIGTEPSEFGQSFFVRDNGMGIPEEKLDYIFRDFKRLHAQDEIEGTGLGLPICKKIVKRHGGKIWATAKPDEGSTFFFTLG
jgi:signal transduction histidine kinase